MRLLSGAAFSRPATYSLVHEREERVQVYLIILAVANYVVDYGLDVGKLN